MESWARRRVGPDWFVTSHGPRIDHCEWTNHFGSFIHYLVSAKIQSQLLTGIKRFDFHLLVNPLAEMFCFSHCFLSCIHSLKYTVMILGGCMLSSHIYHLVWFSKFLGPFVPYMRYHLTTSPKSIFLHFQLTWWCPFWLILYNNSLVSWHLQICLLWKWLCFQELLLLPTPLL